MLSYIIYEYKKNHNFFNLFNSKRFIMYFVYSKISIFQGFTLSKTTEGIVLNH